MSRSWWTLSIELHHKSTSQGPPRKGEIDEYTPEIHACSGENRPRPRYWISSLLKKGAVVPALAGTTRADDSVGTPKVISRRIQGTNGSTPSYTNFPRSYTGINLVSLSPASPVLIGDTAIVANTYNTFSNLYSKYLNRAHSR